jgi:predicted dehydrogenase
MEDLKRTDYGLCVFHANNDMPDHQVVTMQFEGGATATLTFNAFNGGGRYTRIYGTKGELYAFMSDEKVYVRTFEDGKTEYVTVSKVDEAITGGHGGGDYGIVYDLYDYLNGTYSGLDIAEIGVSVQNHMIGFAAEKARLEDKVVDVQKFCEEYKFEI